MRQKTKEKKDKNPQKEEDASSSSSSEEEDLGLTGQPIIIIPQKLNCNDF